MFKFLFTKNLKKSKNFSNFFHEATLEERQEVFSDIAKKASEDQRKIMGY